MRVRFAIIAALAASGMLHAADSREVYEQAVQAKGGRERLHSIHSLAIYMKPAEVNLPGALTNWLCVFPDRYFEYQGMGAAREYAMVVDASTGRAAVDATGQPRHNGQLNGSEHDQLALNQIVFLLESAWLQPQPVEMKSKILIVEAAGRTYKLFLNKDNLPERILSPPVRGEKPKVTYDYKLQHYQNFQGVMLPTRVTQTGAVRQATWDADYEVDAKYNPKVFERMPDLHDGPEPWRR